MRALRGVVQGVLFLFLECLIFCDCIAAGFFCFNKFSDVVGGFNYAMNMHAAAAEQKFLCTLFVCLLALMASKLLSGFICTAAFYVTFLIDAHICGNESNGFSLTSACDIKSVA